jgi:hypothetical protein
MCTPVRDLQVSFKIPYVYDYITKLCKTRSEFIQNHINPNVRGIGQAEARHRKYKGLKLVRFEVFTAMTMKKAVF